MDDGYGHPGIFLAAAAIAVIAGYLIWRYRKSKAENVTEEDIKTMVNEGHEQGVLESSEAEMISNIFEFDDKEAGDIMTHRKNIVALDGSMTVREAQAIPVFRYMARIWTTLSERYISGMCWSM